MSRSTFLNFTKIVFQFFQIVISRNILSLHMRLEDVQIDVV